MFLFAHKDKKVNPSAFSGDTEMTSLLFILIVSFIASLAKSMGPVQFPMDGPLSPVTAILGEDVVLRYHLSPRTRVQNMEIKWFRSQNSSYVHYYQHGRDYSEGQQLRYHGRTQFLRDGRDKGKIDLRIFNVSLFDEGQYHCSVNNGSFTSLMGCESNCIRCSSYHFN